MSSRLPYFLLLNLTVGVLAYVSPALPWRWPLLLGFLLPMAVMLGFEGPYVHNTGNLTFPLQPAVVIAFAVAWLRSRIDLRNRREA
jgi:hypothetical protein